MASDVTIRGNQDLLTNALDNVLMNAILYSPQREHPHFAGCAYDDD